MRASTIIAASLPLNHITAYAPSLIPSAIKVRNGRIREGRGRLSVTFSKKNGDHDDDDEEEWLDLNAPIDFTNLENKIYERDSINMGWIRAREPPREHESLEPLTEKEMEMYLRRTRMIQKKDGKRQLIDKWFPWVSPLMSFFVPRKMTASSRISNRFISKNIISGKDSGRNLLMSLNIIAYIYQIVTAVQYLPGFNRILAASIASDPATAAIGEGVPLWSRSEIILRALGIIGGGSGVLITSSRGIAAHFMGPFFIDFAHQPYPLSHYQKHRYLTSGFLHGSLVHLGMNLRALASLPNWLENGIGKGVYLSAFFVAIVTGNIAYSMNTLGQLPGYTFSPMTIGASGGICGLYGLMFASLWKMSNSNAAIQVFKQMLWLVGFGYLVPNVSNAAHVGGFIGGCLVGFLFGPGYFMTRGRSLDKMDPEFRNVVGPGKYPDAYRSLIPLKYLWAGVLAAMIVRPDLRVIPMAILKGIVKPGELSNVRRLLL